MYHESGRDAIAAAQDSGQGERRREDLGMTVFFARTLRYRFGN